VQFHCRPLTVTDPLKGQHFHQRNRHVGQPTVHSTVQYAETTMPIPVRHIARHAVQAVEPLPVLTAPLATKSAVCSRTLPAHVREQRKPEHRTPIKAEEYASAVPIKVAKHSLIPRRCPHTNDVL